MESKNKKAIILLWLAFLLIVGCAFTVYFFGYLENLWKTLGIASLASFVVYLFLDRQIVLDIFSKRRTRYGLNVLVSSLIVLAIAVFANLIAKEHDWKKDYTKSQKHSLSEQTEKVIGALKGDLKVKVVTDSKSRPKLEEYFGRYTYLSKNIKMEYLDLVRDFEAVKSYSVTPGGAAIFETGTRTARIDNLSPDDPKIEEKITNAIIKVSKGEKKNLYFVTGHGELPFSGEGLNLSDLKNILGEGRYNVKELMLVQEMKIPTDAEVVICVGPKSAFMENELKVVEDYLKSGGKFLFLLEPTSPESFKTFLAKFGVDFKPKKIIFEASNLKAGSPINVVVVTYDKNHEITKKADMPSILLGAAPVGKLANAPADYKVTSLLSSSSFSYEADYISAEKIKMEKTAPKGPFSLAVAVSGTVKGAETKPAETAKPAEAADAKKDKEFRLVVFGDSEFVTNGPLKNAPMNSDLFQNTLSWLALEEDLISIRPKGGDTPDFEITEIRSKVIRATSIVFIPLITIILGVSVWRSRRRK